MTFKNGELNEKLVFVTSNKKEFLNFKKLLLKVYIYLNAFVVERICFRPTLAILLDPTCLI